MSFLRFAHCGFLVLLFLSVGTLRAQRDASEVNREALKKVKDNPGFSPDTPSGKYVLDFNTPTDPDLQKVLEEFDAELSGNYDIEAGTAVGLLDLKTLQVAMINPDHADYSPSSPKCGILLAYFQLHPEAATKLDTNVRSELEQIAKGSGIRLTSVYSQRLGLKNIQEVLNAHNLYNSEHGGLWVGKHYGNSEEVYLDPRNGLSHATTVRQLLRYFLFLEQGKLVSTEASKVMREVYEAPDVAHEEFKIVKALKDRNLQIIRQRTSWENFHLDSGVIKGGNRHYILVVIANHRDGEEYIEKMAVRVDDLMKERASK